MPDWVLEDNSAKFEQLISRVVHTLSQMIELYISCLTDYITIEVECIIIQIWLRD